MTQAIAQIFDPPANLKAFESTYSMKMLSSDVLTSGQTEALVFKISECTSRGSGYLCLPGRAKLDSRNGHPTPI